MIKVVTWMILPVYWYVGNKNANIYVCRGSRGSLPEEIV